MADRPLTLGASGFETEIRTQFLPSYIVEMRFSDIILHVLMDKIHIYHKVSKNREINVSGPRKTVGHGVRCSVFLSSFTDDLSRFWPFVTLI